MTNLDSIWKNRDTALPTKVHLVKAMVFPVVMYQCELDYKESWAPKNWCFWTVVLGKTLESPLDCKPVNPEGNQSSIFIRRTDAEAEAPILWSPDAKNWLIEKDPEAEKDKGQEQKGITEDEMVGWHYRLDGHELSKLRELMMDREAWRATVMGLQRIRHDWTEHEKALKLASLFTTVQVHMFWDYNVDSSSTSYRFATFLCISTLLKSPKTWLYFLVININSKAQVK